MIRIQLYFIPYKYTTIAKTLLKYLLHYPANFSQRTLGQQEAHRIFALKDV